MLKEIKVSGLGFEMEFNLIELLNEGFDSYLNSTDFDSDYGVMYPSINDYKNKINGSNLTYGEFKQLTDANKSEGFFVVDSIENTIARSGDFKPFWKLMPVSVYLNDFNYLSNNYNKKSCDGLHLSIKDFYDKSADLTTVESKMAYNLVVYLIESGLVKDAIVDSSKDMLRKYFNAFHKMKLIYVSRFLDLNLKNFTGRYCSLDKTMGEFSSTYKVVITFGNVSIKSDVIVKSNNLA